MSIEQQHAALTASMQDFIQNTALNLSLVSENEAATVINMLREEMRAAYQTQSDPEAHKVITDLLTMVVLHRADIINGAGSISTRMH